MLTVKVVVCIADIASMPSECDALVSSLVEHLVRAFRISVTHVVQDSEAVRASVTSRAGGGEVQDVGFCGAIRGRNLVVISRAGLKTGDLYVVEKLCALGFLRVQ